MAPATGARRLRPFTGTDGATTGSVNACSRSSRTSPAACRRLRGSFSRHRCSNRRIEGGPLGGSRPVGISLQYARQDIGRVLAFERWPAGDHLVQQAAKRKDVGALVDRTAPGLLRRHVGRGSANHSRVRGHHAHRRRVRHGGAACPFKRVRLVRDELRQSKIEDLYAAFGGDLHVAGLRSR
jgi:hypothetical protein